MIQLNSTPSLLLLLSLQAVIEDNFQEIVAAALAAHDSGDLAAALASGHDGFKVREHRHGSTAAGSRGEAAGVLTQRQLRSTPGPSALAAVQTCTVLLPVVCPSARPRPLPLSLAKQKWLNSVGKAQGRKGKRLFMPMRIAFTGRMSGPDVGEVRCAWGLVRAAAWCAVGGSTACTALKQHFHAAFARIAVVCPPPPFTTSSPPPLLPFPTRCSTCWRWRAVTWRRRARTWRCRSAWRRCAPGWRQTPRPLRLRREAAACHGLTALLFASCTFLCAPKRTLCSTLFSQRAAAAGALRCPLPSSKFCLASPAVLPRLSLPLDAVPC